MKEGEGGSAEKREEGEEERHALLLLEVRQNWKSELGREF